MKRQRSRRRPGFTMVDLLVVVGLLLFLAAVLLPVLFRVRSSAGQISATNSLRQLGLAVHNAHDAFQRMPPILGRFPNKNSPQSTLHFSLLPFMEQEALYRKHLDDPLGAMDVVIREYADPRDPSAPSEGKFQGWLATTNYAGNWQVFRDTGGTLVQITDGTSNTFMWAQRYQICKGQPTGWNYSRLYYWSPMFGYYSKARFQANPRQEDCDPALPQALSSSGILVTMCDGSVRPVSPNVSPDVWWLVTDPSDGQAIPANF